MTSNPLRCICSFAILLAFSVVPISAECGEATSSFRYVSDLRGFLSEHYAYDLEVRLSRFDENTGLAIHVVTASTAMGGSLADLATEQFEMRRLAESGASGAVLIVLDINGHRAAIRTSENIAERFARSGVEEKGVKIFQLHSKERERAVETTIVGVLRQLNWWFYVFESSPLVPYVRFPTGEMLLLVFAPVLSILTGISMMAFTSAAALPWWGRFLVGAHSGFFIILIFTWIVRQPGGIFPGMFYYGIFVAIAVTGLIGVLKPFWINETFKGRQSGGWWNGPVYFRYG